MLVILCVFVVLYAIMAVAFLRALARRCEIFTRQDLDQSSQVVASESRECGETPSRADLGQVGQVGHRPDGE